MGRATTTMRRLSVACVLGLVLSACSGSTAQVATDSGEPQAPAAVATTAPLLPVDQDDATPAQAEPEPESAAPVEEAGSAPEPDTLVEVTPVEDPTAEPVAESEEETSSDDTSTSDGDDAENQNEAASTSAEPETQAEPAPATAVPASPTATAVPATPTPVPPTPTPVPPTPEPTPEPAPPAILVPELTGQFATINGGQIDLGSLQGQDVVLWFWAPW